MPFGKITVILQQKSNSIRTKAKFMDKKKVFKLSKTLGYKVLTGIVACVCMSVLSTSCSEEGKDEAPGLWTALDAIKTFPGDTVLVQGQVSNYIGLSRVDIKCDAWGISQSYQLQGKQSKVFNYNYQMAVPQDATFGADLTVTVTDKEGKTTTKAILMTYLDDTTKPWCTNDMPWQVSVDFDPELGYGVYAQTLNMADDRQLKSCVVSIPALGYEKNYELKGRSFNVTEQIQVSLTGEFPMTVTVKDETGNETVYDQQIVCMLAEDEDGFEDYPVMWMFCASENPGDYMDGFFAPLNRQDAYQYKGSFYADKDGYQLYVVPAKATDSNVFGISPYVSSKLMNKTGYVKPITIEKKGYYGLWIDVQAHAFSVWELDTSAAYTGSLTLSGCGFKDFGDWGTPDTEMTRNGFRYTQTVDQNGSYSDTRYYYAARVSDWAYILRFWSDANGCGWWEDTGGYGGNVGTYVSDYDGLVEVTFDTALLWATIKKK